MRDLLSIGTSRGCEMIGTGIGLGLSGFRVNPPGIPATLDLDFASRLSLTSPSGITPSFSRASTGTYFTSSGVLTSAAINGPRFNHVYNGSSWVSKGLLVEEQRTNLHLYSQQFDNAAWLKFDSTVSANFAAAPDSSITADKVIPNTANAAHGLYNNSAISISSGANYTTSIYAKASGYNFIFVVGNVNASSTLGGVCVNLTDGSQSNGGASGTYSVTNVGNGWWRISCSLTSVGTNGYFEIYPRSTAGNNASFAGNGTDGVLIWGAQIEAGSFPTSYIPTTTAAVTRSADVCQITGGDFTSFWNASEGSFVTEADSIGYATTGSDRYIIAFNSSGTANISHAIFLPSTGLTFDVYNSAIQARISNTQPNAGVVFKLASAYKVNDFAASLNGGAVQTDTSGTVPTITNVGIGHYPSFNQYSNCHIARLRYYNTRLTNSQLQGLTL